MQRSSHNCMTCGTLSMRLARNCSLIFMTTWKRYVASVIDSLKVSSVSRLCLISIPSSLNFEVGKLLPFLLGEDEDEPKHTAYLIFLPFPVGCAPNFPGGLGCLSSTWKERVALLLLLFLCPFFLICLFVSFVFLCLVRGFLPNVFLKYETVPLPQLHKINYITFTVFSILHCSSKTTTWAVLAKVYFNIPLNSILIRDSRTWELNSPNL